MRCCDYEWCVIEPSINFPGPFQEALAAVNIFHGSGLDKSHKLSLLIHVGQLVERTMVQHPDIKLCVSGHSQGSQVVHNALEILTGDEAATMFIDSVVTFGDPDHKIPFGYVPDDKISVVCHKGDDICLNKSGIKLPHFTYCHNVGAEEAFVKRRSNE
jgi:hypothetical protein